MKERVMDFTKKVKRKNFTESGGVTRSIRITN